MQKESLLLVFTNVVVLGFWIAALVILLKEKEMQVCS